MPRSKKNEFRIPEPEKPSLSVRKVSEITGLSIKTVQNYYNDGILKGYKKGFGITSDIRIYVESLEKFMEARRNK